MSKKVVIITGAGKGIGLAAAKKFAREGWSVAMLARTKKDIVDAANQIKEEGFEAEAFVCDVAKLEDCEKAVTAVVEKWGRIDCLYNNAGILVDRLDVLNLPMESFKKEYDVNVFGTMQMIQLVAKVMVHKKIEGSIINTSSLNGETVTQDPVGYVSSKWAINGITRSCAFQLAKYKIRVNAVAPGVTLTPMAQAGWDNEEMRAAIAKMHLRNMWIQPEMVADAAFFLASDASYGVNGQILHVDDGFCVGK